MKKQQRYKRKILIFISLSFHKISINVATNLHVDIRLCKRHPCI